MIGVYVALLQTWEALGRDAFTDEPGKKKKKKRLLLPAEPERQ